MNAPYLFTSPRLGFRTWSLHDLDAFAAMNADTEVMEHFPKSLTYQETEAMIARLCAHQAEHGYCYYAVETLEGQEFIGFVGLAYQDYDVPFLPATDIGWRLKRSVWGKGYATEGAKRCLEMAFDELGLDHLVAVCTATNRNSEHVMQKIGMQPKGSFMHPKLDDYPEYQKCLWYEINRTK